MSATKQIGGIEVFKTLNSTKYEYKLLVPEEELGEHESEIGDRALWAPGSNASVIAVNKTWLASGVWLLKITAEEIEKGKEYWITGDTLDDFVEKTFSVGELYCPKEWWGVRVAGHADCSPWLDESEALIESGRLKYKNIHGDWANPGDWIFRNAVPLYFDGDGVRRSDPLPGSPDYSASPFELSDDQALPIEYLEQTVKTRIYECAYNTRSNPGYISFFSGVSGDFRANCEPEDYQDSEKKWKALYQEARRLRSSGGLTFTHVIRRMMEAPFPMRWSPSKNGGTWIW